MALEATTIRNLNLDHLVGRQVGSSTMIREVARGGMGAVFVAFQHTLKRQIAVKVLPKSILTPTTARIFQQEAEAAAILSHPNIIPIYEVGETEDFLFFTMQLVNGRPLSHIIQMAHKNPLPSRRTLPLETTMDLVWHLLDAMDYAHGQDIVHRDIKPENILVESVTRRLILTDFGVSQFIRGFGDGSTLIMGTPKYMAPEQIMNSEVDGRADIFAIGTLLYEMLSPVPLFSGLTAINDLLTLKLRHDASLFPRRPSEINDHVGPAMDDVVMKALAFEPEDRFATCREFSKELKGAMDP